MNREKSYIYIYNIQSAIFSISKCKNCTLEEQAIINILKNNPLATQDNIAKEINKSVRTVKLHMSEMKEKGLIERKNGKRNGKWVVKQQH